MIRVFLHLLKFCLFPLILAYASLVFSDVNGHLKIQGQNTAYPNNSIYSSDGRGHQSEYNADLRINLRNGFKSQSNWSYEVAYQLLMYEGNRGINFPYLGTNAVDDDSRFFTLTDTLSESEDAYLLHRLDRLNISYTNEKIVLRMGRQALSWGNGIMFSVMDLVNPFDGRVFDQEYKSGDDMVYAQYLLDDGSDFQVASVFRRETPETSQSKAFNTHSIKYHMFVQSTEIDLLIAKHYGDEVFGVGVGMPIGGAVAHLELTDTQTDYGKYFSGLGGISYSWVAFKRNMSGSIEYFFQESGIKKRIDLAALNDNPYLLLRLSRNETQWLGRSYLGANTLIEFTPLFITQLSLFQNMDDHSSLIQISSNYDWKENLQWFFAFSLPIGAQGKEFGGLESPSPGLFYSFDYQALTKLSWYF